MVRRMDWSDQAAEQLERLLRDPIAEAVRGTAEIVSISTPEARGRYQEAQLELRAWAEGIPPVTVSMAVVLPTKHWPAAGVRLPAMIPPTAPQELEVDWSRLAR